MVTNVFSIRSNTQRTLTWIHYPKMCLKVDVFILVKKPWDSGGPEVIWKFDDRLKIEQVRDLNRVVRLRNSVIHVLPARPLVPLSKEILCFESGCHHTCYNPQSTQKGVRIQILDICRGRRRHCPWGSSCQVKKFKMWKKLGWGEIYTWKFFGCGGICLISWAVSSGMLSQGN